MMIELPQAKKQTLDGQSSTVAAHVSPFLGRQSNGIELRLCLGDVEYSVVLTTKILVSLGASIEKFKAEQNMAELNPKGQRI